MNTYQINISFQSPATPIAEGIFSFHNDLIIFLIGILVFVRYVLYICLNEFSTAKHGVLSSAYPITTYKLIHASTLEIIWTIIPALILVVIAIPSFSLLYSVDEIVQPIITIKAVGHQWYWSYEYVSSTWAAASQNRVNMVEFDRYILSDDELNLQRDTLKEELNAIIAADTYTSFTVDESTISFNLDLVFPTRNLTVDNHLVLPINIPISVIATSTDVLHSWAVPSLGVKLDSCPGRLNQTSIFIKRSGVYYGQCSEICGVNHGFRPIGIIGINEIVLSNTERVFFDIESVNLFLS